MNLYREKYGKKQIHVIDSESASCGETQIVKKQALLESICHQTLEKRKEVIHDDSLDDPECFAKIEKIVCL